LKFGICLEFGIWNLEFDPDGMRTHFFSGLRRSFRAAARGIAVALREERSFRVMVACALIVIALICLLPLSVAERLLLLLVTGTVLVLELLNTALERFVDVMKPRLSPYVRDVKDLMAAAVLLASGVAAIIALVILGPYAVLFLMNV
jgi:diacylglycerol kinase